MDRAPHAHAFHLRQGAALFQRYDEPPPLAVRARTRAKPGVGAAYRLLELGREQRDGGATAYQRHHRHRKQAAVGNPTSPPARFGFLHYYPGRTGAAARRSHAQPSGEPDRGMRWSSAVALRVAWRTERTFHSQLSR